jgi:hypothetical protein
MGVEVLNKIGNREPKHLVSEVPQSYRAIQRDDQGETLVAKGSLFIIAAWVALRRLEIIPVVGQAAVGENALPNSFRLNLRKWWQYVNCKAGASRRRTGRGACWGRHGRENGREYCLVCMIKGVESKGSYCLVHTGVLETCYTKARLTNDRHRSSDIRLCEYACLL